ncbi:unnamed protein product, partial [marine sediment metagenome]
VYISLDKEVFEETKDKALEEAKNLDESDDNPRYLYPEADLRGRELTFDEKSQELSINGQLYSGQKELGYLSLEIPLEIDMIIEIIEYYRKVLGKIKTVLEATK